jgi:hypothetical protein
MIAGILPAAILVVAVVFAIRPWYRALSGKSQGCAGCSGACGHDSTCSHAHNGQKKGAEVVTSHQNNTDQNKEL